MAANYTKVYNDAYPSGWKAKPDLSTPYTATIKNNEVATFKSLENFLYNHPLPTSIGDLEDVDLTEIENGNVLVWDSTAGKFVPGEGGGGGGGASYRYDEHVIGADEDGNILYSKVIVKLPPSGETSIGTASNWSTTYTIFTGTGSSSCRIKRYDGVIFYGLSSIPNYSEALPFNYIDPETLTNAQADIIWTKAAIASNKYLTVGTNNKFFNSSTAQYQAVEIRKIWIYLEYYKES